MAPASTDDSNFKQIKRHEKFYIPGADLVFLVEGVLIRVHRYFFDRESAVFRDEVLPVPEGKSPLGYTDSTAIAIDAPLNDFTKLLSIFYNPTYTLYELTILDWTTVLRLAHLWKFDEVKRLVVRELHKHTLDVVARIALYQAYDVGSAALIPLYASLCSRAEPPSDDEADALGIKTTVRVYRARERLRTVPVVAGDRSSAEGQVLRAVGEVFGMETPPTSPVDDAGATSKKKKKATTTQP